MGRINLATDLTGKLSDIELNAQNINDIVNELNRNSDQLDSLSKNLNIIAYNKLSVTWPGTGGGLPTTVTDLIKTGAASTFLAFYDRNDIANQLFSVPNVHYDGSGNIASIITGNTFVLGAASIGFNIDFLANGSPVSFNFYYYILQQPTNALT